MAYCHHRAAAAPVGSRGGDLELLRKSILPDGEGVVPGGREGAWDSPEDPKAIVRNGGGHAVNGLICRNDLSPQRGGNRLMAQADSQDGNHAGQLLHGVHAHPGPGRIAGPRREDERPGIQTANRGGGDLPVSPHQGFLSQLLQVAGKVVDKAVVVIDEEDHPGGNYDSPIQSCQRIICRKWFGFQVKRCIKIQS